MGTDKAALVLNGATLIEHTASILFEVTPHVTVVGRNFSHPRIASALDTFPEWGALGGVHGFYRDLDEVHIRGGRVRDSRRPRRDDVRHVASIQLLDEVALKILYVKGGLAFIFNRSGDPDDENGLGRGGGLSQYRRKDGERQQAGADHAAARSVEGQGHSFSPRARPADRWGGHLTLAALSLP